MHKQDIIKEGSRFFTLVPMKILCNAVMERTDVYNAHQFRHPEMVEIPQDYLFTIDGVLDDEIYCDFDEHDRLCEMFVPAHVRENTGTLVFITCEFVAARTNVIKLCEHVGFEENPPDYNGPIIF